MRTEFMLNIISGQVVWSFLNLIQLRGKKRGGVCVPFFFLFVDQTELRY